MDTEDLLYRAFRDYREHTEHDRDCERRRRALTRAGGNDALEVIETECEIENDWLEAAEEGLEYIGRAIGEERQFIRSNGEVVPIEKVKSVSRESAEHLARHGEFITRRQGEDIVPDKLYTVERLNDYTVYENRFLYMLLCYLRDFISYRYGKITEYVNTYRGRLRVEKTADTGARRTSVTLVAEDVRKNDERMLEKSGVKSQLSRMDGALKTVHLLLGTPLMQEVAKVPMLKPPVTETNVLKMDKNFKGALRLYYFLVSYQKDGFTVRQTTRRFSPLSDGAADEFSEAEELVTFLMYEYGMQIGEELRRAYLEEQERRKREEARREEERFRGLRKRVRESGVGAEEYMLLLESRCRSLEKEKASLAEAYSRSEGMLAESVKRGGELELALRESREALESAEAAHRGELERLAGERRAEVSALEERYRGELSALRLEHERERAAGEKAFAAERAKLEEARADAEERFACSEEMRERAEAAAARADGERILAEARLNAVKSEYGAFGEEEDFTSMERFDEIERQYRAFRAFFKKEWRKAKRRIRKEAFADVFAAEDKGGGQDSGKEDGKPGKS